MPNQNDIELVELVQGAETQQITSKKEGWVNWKNIKHFFITVGLIVLLVSLIVGIFYLLKYVIKPCSSGDLEKDRACLNRIISIS